jgi:hypothetical protein
VKKTRDSGVVYDDFMPRKIWIAAGFGGVPFILTFVVLGAFAPGYDSLTQTISSLELTSFGMAQRVNFFVFGLLLITFAVALKRELNGGWGGSIIPLFQFVSGVGVIGDALFIHPPLHLMFDLIAFNATLLVLFLFAWRLWGDARWKGWAAYSIVTAVLMTAFLTAFGFANHLGGPAGAWEKMATVVRTVWSVALAGRLLAGARLDAVPVERMSFSSLQR